MNFDVRLGTLLNQKADASGLIARKVLIDNSSTRQDQRKFFIGNFVWWIEFDRVKLCLAVWMIEAIFEQTWGSRMIFSRTGPENSVVLFDLLPRHAIVIGIAPARCGSQLVENLPRRIKTEIFFATHPVRNFLHNPPVRARRTRR